MLAVEERRDTRRTDRSWRWHAAAASIALVAALWALAVPARATELTSFGVRSVDEHGAAVTQAGSHPDVTTALQFSVGPNGPDGNFKDTIIDLPAGLVFNPTVTPRCTQADLRGYAMGFQLCHPATQVGVANLRLDMGGGGFDSGVLPVYNVVPPPGVPGRFAMNLGGVIVNVDAAVRSGGDYGITAIAANTSLTVPVTGVTLTLWGVPADPRHDPERWTPTTPQVPGTFGASTAVPQKALVSAPGDCVSGLRAVTLRANTWQEPDAWMNGRVDHDLDGNPLTVTGCERLSFEPKLSLRPQSAVASAPTGLDVAVEIPQSDDPRALSKAMLHGVTVELPEGMALNPGSADGLAACTPAEIRLADASDPSCPDASKLGTVQIRSPLLDDPMEGSVYLAKQGENPFGSLIALYAVAKGAGVVVKLPGKVALDPASGRLTVSFDGTPRLPFDRFTMRFEGGPRAPLVNPATCGVKTTTARFVPWSAADPEHPTATEVQTTVDRFEITSGPGGGPCGATFAPTLSAGTADPIAGAFSPFSLTVARADGQQALAAIERVELPRGLLAMVGSVPLCPEANAAAGTCPAASRVGGVQVAAGDGAQPVWLPQAGRAPTSVSLAGPYKGAPYSLSIVVPAQAGPLDLGTVVVRSAVFVDPRDAHVTAVTDPLPSILQGIPLRLREVRLALDRARFTFNPTSCAEQRVAGTVTSVDGTRAALSSRFQVGACAALPLSPAIAVQGGGRGNTKRFTHPALKVSIKQTSAQAHLDQANVVLPKAFNVDLNAPSLKAACPREVYAQDKCSKVATVGTVKAITPVFKEPLTGPAFLLQKKGQLPDIVMRLRNVHYRIDLIGVLDFLSDGRVITRVRGIPDAPITSFELQIKGGKGGSLLSRSDLCARKAATQATFRGQNGRVSVKTPTNRIGGCAAAAQHRATGSRS